MRLALLNPKGGTEKTTSAVFLFAGLNLEGPTTSINVNLRTALPGGAPEPGAGAGALHQHVVEHEERSSGAGASQRGGAPVSKAGKAKELVERMKTVAARRGTAPKEAGEAPPPVEPAEPAVKKKVRTTVDLDPEMHRFLKVYAAGRG